MKFDNPKSVIELAQKYQLKVIGNKEQLAFGINEIHKVTLGDITFVDVEKYYNKSLHSLASIIIINNEVDCPPGKTLLICEKPFEVYNDIVATERPLIPLTSQISSSALIHPEAIIEPGVVIGHHAVIGAGSHIQANVYIGEYTVIGNQVNIQDGTIIGTDAFYYKKTNGIYSKWRSCGRVIIHNDVEVGAGCTINKGVSGDTIIGQGTKIDCQVHIGHGVVVGKHCLFAAQVGIAGKTIIGDHVTLYGQVGVAQNLHIGSNVVVYAASGIGKDLETGKTYFGSPADEALIKFKEIAALKQLPEMIKRKLGN